MATAILKEIFEIELVRTRDEEMLKNLDIVYDVGDGEFDHHQVDKEFREGGTPYAASGLIWRKFGKEVVRINAPTLSEDEVYNVFRYIDRNLIESIDASDNGIRGAMTIIPTPNISTLISNFNPPWDADAENEDEYFHQAVKLADVVLGNALAQQISTVKAKAHIAAAFEKRPRPELLVLERSYPWARVLNSIDRERQVLFVAFPREEEFLLQTVRGNGSLGNRKSLPEAWAGKRDEELNETVGIDDGIFCHSGRFIAGARSFESIMKMADIAIEAHENKPPKRFGHVLRKFITKQLKSIGIIETSGRNNKG
ncbi:MAG: hypothetical protein A2Y23_09275 [Clostridiales bacterium GWB2_37_7]|nr:MAG: hypothetical protein A2Y23_09275 [Clostridiales bacterium GWB2_37_7]